VNQLYVLNTDLSSVMRWTVLEALAEIGNMDNILNFDYDVILFLTVFWTDLKAFVDM
jgi:hypothetical protein